MRRGIGRLRAGGSAGFSPSQITFTTGVWLDPSDTSTAFQDTAGTTPTGASGNPVGRRNDKSGNSRNVLQATAGARPLYNLASSISSDVMDGSDDGYATATFLAGGLGNNMDLFVAIKRASAVKGIPVCDSSGGNFVGLYDSAGGVAIATAGAGASETYFVDGVQVGGTHNTTRVQLDTALTTGVWHVLEARNLDLSAWLQFTVSGYATFIVNGNIGGLILCPAQSSTVRGQLRTYLGNKVGLSL